MLKSIGTVLNRQIRSGVVNRIRNYSYESDVSLKTLHPTSNLKLTSPAPPPLVNFYF